MTRDDELRLHAYLDGELAATEANEFERRLAQDGELRAGLSELRAMSQRIRSQARYHDAPPQLRAQVLGQVRRQAPRRPARAAWWSSLVAGAAVAAMAAWFAPALLQQIGAGDPRVQEVLDNHLRATLGTHWVDVASSDQHTVKPWLSARLGFSPAVPDLADQGFELIGGRLDVLEAKPVATLVYRRRQHMISVFVWPGEPAAARAPIERRGYHLVRFERSGMSYWAVSDLNATELEDLARLIESSS
jgi:anti-sigma factor RsiW